METDTWLNYIKENQVFLKFALDTYDKEPYNIRQIMAERGVEMTPDQLKELIELIRDSLEEI